MRARLAIACKGRGHGRGKGARPARGGFAKLLNHPCSWSPMNDCIFCAIAAGRVPCAEVAQDDRAFAFLDINPVRPGHTLVIPKRHAAKLQDADPEDAAAVLRLAQRLLPAIARQTGSPDATLAVHDGKAAGQEVPHLHLHIIPRRAGDHGGPVHALFPAAPKADPEDLHDLAVRLQDDLERQVAQAAPGGSA